MEAALPDEEDEAAEEDAPAVDVLDAPPLEDAAADALDPVEVDAPVLLAALLLVPCAEDAVPPDELPAEASDDDALPPLLLPALAEAAEDVLPLEPVPPEEDAAADDPVDEDAPEDDDDGEPPAGTHPSVASRTRLQA